MDTVISRISNENFSRAKNFAVGGYVNYGKFSDFNITNFGGNSGLRDIIFLFGFHFENVDWQSDLGSDLWFREVCET